MFRVSALGVLAIGFRNDKNVEHEAETSLLV